MRAMLLDDHCVTDQEDDGAALVALVADVAIAVHPRSSTWQSARLRLTRPPPIPILRRPVGACPCPHPVAAFTPLSRVNGG